MALGSERAARHARCRWLDARRPSPRWPTVVLFVLGFESRGFNWCHVALFAAMIASTDALSVTAILKKSERAWLRLPPLARMMLSLQLGL